MRRSRRPRRPAALSVDDGERREHAGVLEAAAVVLERAVGQHRARTAARRPPCSSRASAPRMRRVRRRRGAARRVGPQARRRPRPAPSASGAQRRAPDRVARPDASRRASPLASFLVGDGPRPAPGAGALDQHLALVGSPCCRVLMNFLRLLQRDVRRQRRHLGIGLELEHHRPVGGSASSQAAPMRVGIVDRRCPSGRSARRSGGRARSGMCWVASNFGKPSITRCSQVTWFRSSLFQTQQIQLRVCPALPVLGHGDQLGHVVHLHGAVADQRDHRPVRDGRTWRRSHRAPPRPSRRGRRTASTSCRAGSSGRARTSWRRSRSRW